MRRITLILVALLATCAFAQTAKASGGNNVCANGVMTKKAFLSCYNNNASARALYNSLGVTAGGIKAAKTVKVCANQGYLSYGRNYTPGSKSVSPDGQRFYRRPLSSVMHGCASAWYVLTKKGAVRVLKFCGNPEVRPHKKPKCKCKTKKKPKKPAQPTTPVTPPVINCPTGTSPVLINSAVACQGNTSIQTADQKVNVEPICHGPNTNSSQCNTNITQYISQTTVQVNANCSKVIISYGDGSTAVTFKDSDGNVISEAYCSSQGTTTPPPPPPDRAPWITCTVGAHMMLVPGDSVDMYCEAHDPDGDATTTNIVSNDTNVITVSGIDTHYGFLFDGKTPCPSGSVCTKATIWAHSVGIGSVTATAYAGGLSTALPPFVFPVVQGDPVNF